MRNKNSSEHRRKVKFGGIEQKVCMAKIRNFAEIAPNLPFTEYDFRSTVAHLKRLIWEG